jgi:hypothetical protein
VHHRAPSTTVRCGPSVHVDSDLYGSDERGARVQRQQRQHPLSSTGVRGHGRGAPPVGRDISDVVGLNLNRRLRYQRSKQHHGPASSLPPSSKPTMIPNEDWQVVKPCHLRCRAPSAAPRSYSPHYRATVEGRCLNCLSSSHRRAGCCLPTHCFNCHGLRHHLRDCKRPHKSSIVVGVSDAVSQAPRDTFVSLGDGGTPGTPAPSIASRFPKPDLVFPVESVCSIPRLWDPMVKEATLGTTIATPGRSF